MPKIVAGDLVIQRGPIRSVAGQGGTPHAVVSQRWRMKDAGVGKGRVVSTLVDGTGVSPANQWLCRVVSGREINRWRAHRKTDSC